MVISDYYSPYDTSPTAISCSAEWSTTAAEQVVYISVSDKSPETKVTRITFVPRDVPEVIGFPEAVDLLPLHLGHRPAFRVRGPPSKACGFAE